MNLTPRQQHLLDEFLLIDDPQERLAAIVDRARHRPKLPVELRTPAHRVPGCTSSVWLVPELRQGGCHFRVGADSPVVLGLVALVTDFHTGLTPVEILATSLDPLEHLGLSRSLSPTRRHGLAAVRAALHAFAQIQLPANPAKPRE